jgi:hypothetical protein
MHPFKIFIFEVVLVRVGGLFVLQDRVLFGAVA